MKKLIIALLVISASLTVTGCEGTKILHCDYCNTEVIVGESSNMDEDWIIYCDKCNEELFGEDSLLGA